MGVPRLTQDLQPYLENTTINRRIDAPSSTVQVKKVVIDGPGMVYHVYNKLSAHQIEQAGRKNLYNPPSYRDLCEAVDIFLTDLEDCGATIVHIYFDGALPEDKRATRLGRLEKTLQQLEVFRLGHPRFGLPNDRNSQRDASTLRHMLWATGIPSNSNAGLPQLPFIVAAAKEYLMHSTWSSRTSTIPGEADSYCAAAARKSQAAVLTNDSDLVLYQDLQESGVVVLLNSLVQNVEETGNGGCICGTCWRPSEIKKKLGITDLLWLGFERMEDANCSFPTLKQRAKERSSGIDEDKFMSFARQFQTQPLGGKYQSADDRIISRTLDLLDPRLAELVVQLKQSSSQKDNSFNLYFPVLHEDPTRDSSWSYGRQYRQLGYSVLLQHYALKSSQHSNHGKSNSDVPVTEFARKGQAISKENVHILSFRECLAMTTQIFKDFESVRTHNDEEQSLYMASVSRYTLHALGDVLLQRIANGKPMPSPYLVAQFLGLTPLPSSITAHSSSMRSRQPNNLDAGWDLLHLHANVQAVLYSLRSLKQCVDCVLLPPVDMTETGSQIMPPITSIPSYTEHRKAMTQSLLTLQGLLCDLPRISALFLDPTDLIAHFSTALSEVERRRLFSRFCTRTEMDLSAFMGPAIQNIEIVQGIAAIKDTPFQEQTSNKRKKKRPNTTSANNSADSKKPSSLSEQVETIQKSRNMFDVLRQRE